MAIQASKPKGLSTLAAFAGLLALPACATVDVNDLQNAVLSPSTAHVRSQITHIIIDSTGHQSLGLSEGSLTTSSRLPIVQKFPSGPIGDILGGRRMDMPRFFTLKTDGSKCWLYDDDNKVLHALVTHNCKAASLKPT